MPGALASTQYYRLYDYTLPGKLVDAIVEDLKAQEPTPAAERQS
jgi:hypothetical protein